MEGCLSSYLFLSNGSEKVMLNDIDLWNKLLKKDRYKFDYDKSVFNRALNMAPGGGPQLSKEVTLAQVVKNCIDWGYPDFLNLYDDVSVRLQYILKTDSAPLLMAGSIRSVMDGVAATILEPKDKALVAINGYWSNLWTEILQTYNIRPIIYRERDEIPINPDGIRNIISSEKGIKALFMTHIDTSTGIINPLGNDPAIIGELCAENDILYVLDIANSPANTNIELDKWQVDCSITGAHKALSFPPGIGITSISPKAWERVEKRGKPIQSWYTDLRRWREYFTRNAERRLTKENNVPFTFPVTILLALNALLEEITEGNLEDRIGRHEKTGIVVRKTLLNMGLELVADCSRCNKFTEGEGCSSKKRFCSNSVVVSKFPSIERFNGGEWLQYMDKRYNVFFAPGIGAYERKAFRIGLMCKEQIDPRNILVALTTLETSLREKGVTIKPGACLKFIDQLN